MSHRNARLTFQGRLLLVRRVRQEGWAVAHTAKAMGISRKCAHYWLKRYDQEGEDGLHDRTELPKDIADLTWLVRPARNASSGKPLVTAAWFDGERLVVIYLDLEGR